MATDAEATVDELLDAIEQGTLVLGAGVGGAPTAPSTRCSPRPTGWPTIPTTAGGRDDLSDLVPRLDPAAAAVRSVGRHVGGVIDAAPALVALATTTHVVATSSAPPRTLRSLVRQYVS